MKSLLSQRWRASTVMKSSLKTQRNSLLKNISPACVTGASEASTAHTADTFIHSVLAHGVSGRSADEQ